MKVKMFLLALILVSQTTKAQDCNASHRFVASPMLQYTPLGLAIGIEGGLMGMESPLDVFAGVALFPYTHPDRMKKANYVPGDIYGRSYMKIGYRAYRKEYVISIIPNAVLGIDMTDGLYTAAGIRVLHPMGNWAISAEPFLMISQFSKEINLQLSVHF
jgi:hypothetical protein